MESIELTIASLRLLARCSRMVAIVLSLFLCTDAAGGYAQVQPSGAASTSDAEIRSFAISSVRPNVNHDGRFRLMFTADGYTATGVTPKQLIQDAFGIYENSRLAGLPGWALKRRYDVDAKVTPKQVANYESLSIGDKRRLLQKLLMQRFNMRAHEELRAGASYSMILSKQGVMLAPPTPLTSDNGRGPSTPTALWVRLRPGRWTAEHCSTGEFAHALALQLQRPVVDNTGIKGRYTFKLDWDPNSGAAPSTTANIDGDLSSGPSIFTALKEQLGLTLLPTKSEVEVVEVDSVSEPSPN